MWWEVVSGWGGVAAKKPNKIRMQVGISIQLRLDVSSISTILSGLRYFSDLSYFMCGTWENGGYCAVSIFLFEVAIRVYRCLVRD